jgi:type IX secretion system PorP/SprF family membrane protein
MHIRHLPLLLITLAFALPTSAQDIHFTQFYMSPVTLNAAMAGKFEGTVRVGGIYRSQWRSVLGAGDYSTPSIFADAPIIRGLRKQDWVGVGLGYVADRAGTGNLERNITNIGASYHLALDRDRRSVLSIGAQFGGVSLQINTDGLKDEFTILNPKGPTSPDITTLTKNQAEPGSYRSTNVGLALTSRLNKQMDVTLGFAMANILAGGTTLLKGGATPPNPGTPTPTPTPGTVTGLRRITGHGTFNIQMNDRTVLTPNFIYQTMGGNQEIMVQALGSYLLDPKRDLTATVGLGYRLGDAANVIVGGKYKDWRFGLAYDINTSDLSADTRYRGGFELALNYIIKIYKPAVVKPKVICPRF